MSWLFFALLYPLIYTVVVYVDKYLLEREVPDFRGLALFAAIVAAFEGVVLYIALGFPALPLLDAMLVMLTGVCGIWGVVLYFKAIAEEDASDVIVLIQMTPVFVLIMAWIFLGETMTARQLIAFFLILGSAIGVSLRGSAGKFRLSTAFFATLTASIIWAIGQVLFKFVVSSTTFWQVAAFEAWGYTVGGVVVYLTLPTVRRAFLKTVREVRPVALGIVAVNEGIAVVAKLVQFLAISLGPVALVSVVSTTQVFFAILAGWLLTLVAPAIYREDITARGLIRKGAFGALMFVGVALLQTPGAG